MDLVGNPLGLFLNTFNAIFEGNDHTISNLIINRDTRFIGLFGYTGSNSSITAVGLLDIDISNIAVSPDLVAGGLVGQNNGVVMGSYATGSATGGAISLRMGGLVGLNNGSVTDSHAAVNIEGMGDNVILGGLVGIDGFRSGTIENSYATGFVAGFSRLPSDLGGLIGLLRSGNSGTVTNSYATGDIGSEGPTNVGSLAGRTVRPITNSYATGSVSGTETSTVGGLIGNANSQDLISYSYWLKEAGSTLNDVGRIGNDVGSSLPYGAGRTAEQLKSPTGPGTALTATTYYNWSINDWDFGTSDQFPALKASDGDTVLPGQRTGLRELAVVTADAILHPAFTPSTNNYVLTAPLNTSIDLTLRAYNANAKVKIIAEGDPSVDYFADKGSSGQSDPIPVVTNTVLVITVADSNDQITSYRIVLIQTNLPLCTTFLDTYTDTDGVAQDMDVDKDGDGLIEVCDLEGLYEMRYQPDGAGYKATADAMPITIGCPAIGGCKGYELTKNLDFMDDASYRLASNKAIYTVADYSDSDDEGWEPIGSSSDTFETMFNGNGYTLSNLMINRSGNDSNGVGLFGYTGTRAQITNLGLLDVNTTGASSVGSLVGVNGGAIRGSYATGDITGTGDRVGGLVGKNNNTIASSYVASSVSGVNRVGGLVGSNDEGSSIMGSYAMLVEVEGSGNTIGGLSGANSGDISDSYVATGTSSVSGVNNVGGLVGWNAPTGTLTNSYTLAAVSGDSRVGGLIGQNASGGTIAQSYWIQKTGFSMSGIGDGQQLSYEATQTAMALKLPTTNTGIYSNWRAPLWDFGTSDQFPILKTSDGDLLPNQGVGLRALKVPTLATELSPVFGDSTTNYVITFFYINTNTQNIVLDLTAYNPDAKIELVKEGESSNYFADKGSSSRSDVILVDDNMVLNITVREANLDTTSYRIEIVSQQVALLSCTAALASIPDDNDGISDEFDIDKDNDGLIEICDLNALNAVRYQLDGSGYRESADTVKITFGCPSSGCDGYELHRNLDFNSDGSYRDTTNKEAWTSGLGWLPIGDQLNSFSGRFEGNNHTIANLYIDRPSDYVGLFRATTKLAKISDLVLSQTNIKGNSYVGSLAGHNAGGVAYVGVEGGRLVGSGNAVGGLLGANTGDDTQR